MVRVGRFVVKELREVIPPTVFFFVVFQTVVVARSLMGVSDTIEMHSTARAVIGGLIVGKAVLVANALPLFHWFRSRLVVSVVWRALLYMLLIVLFQVAEAWVHTLRNGGEGPLLDRMLEGFDGKVFAATHILLGVFVLFYAFAVTTVEVIGAARFRQLFFGTGDGGPDSGDDDA